MNTSYIEYIVSCYKMLHLYICHSAFRSKKSYCMICMQQLYTYTILFGFHDTTPQKKNTDPLQPSSFIINRDPFKSSVRPLRFEEIGSKAASPQRSGSNAPKTGRLPWVESLPKRKICDWSQKKFAELKFHRPTRHSLRVEKTQLLDVTVEGDIRKLISWIHVTHMCRYKIFISDILQYAYMCRY